MSHDCLVAAHDAGGAELLASYIARNNLSCLYLIEGPAIKVFERRLGKNLNLVSMEDGLKNCKWCLCSTSWQSELEWLVVKRAKKLNIKVVSFLDHWVNYTQRFLRNNIQYLPDEIWVADEYAKSKALQDFPDTKVKLINNPYLLDIKDKLKDYKIINCIPNSILYMSENISGNSLRTYGDESYFGYTEFDGLKILLDNRHFLNKNCNHINIRLHPSENKDKYKDIIQKNKKLISISNHSDLLEDIASSDIIAGCESMALVVALVANKKVYSCLPINIKNRLPYNEIIKLLK